MRSIHSNPLLRAIIVSLVILLPFDLFGQVNNGVLVCPDSTFQSLKKLSQSRLKGGNILLFTTTHQDLAWADHMDRCISWRDSLWLTPFIARLDKEPDFKMDVEQVSIIKEYIHRHPEKKSIINKYLEEGRICVGATYNQPYEELYSGESLSREFYLGQLWMKKNFDGYTSKSYFNVDVPGRTLQMPQIMEKADVRNLVISRHGRGLFNWVSPDGSKVRTYSSGHYIFFYNVLAQEELKGIDDFSREAELWYTKYNDVKGAKPVMPAMLNYEFMWDQKPVKNCIPFITKWNSIKEIRTSDGKSQKVNLPKFKYAIADDFYSALDRSSKQLPSINGERPNVWIYIHGPSHEKAITASRDGDRLLPAAEKFGVFTFLVDKDFTKYPTTRLNAAWEAKIFPDHGWGGNQGNITDALFESKYVFAQSEAREMVDQSLSHLANNVKTVESKGIPVVLFNDLSWKRNEVVSVDVSFKEGFAKNLDAYSSDGKLLLSQLSNVEYYQDGSIQRGKLHVMAYNIPPMGEMTCYLKPALTNMDNSSEVRVTPESYENSFYKIAFGQGGIRQIRDKALAKDLIDNSKFMAGEIINMHSVGNGAGEFDKPQMPDMEGFDKTSLHQTDWQIVEKGKLFTSYKYRCQISNAVVEETVRIYNQVKKIDVDVALLNWDNTLYREFRMMLPIAINQGTVKYEVPFGILTVGKDEMPGNAGERYLTENKMVRPRGIQNWMNVSDSESSVTMSSSVVGADFVDPTPGASTGTILQALLMASRRSCHGQGNEYILPGDHHFKFSITLSLPNDIKSNQFGVSANDEIKTVFAPTQYKDASLSENECFMAVDNENVVVSALKKCEDDESLIVRLYNLTNKPQRVSIKLPLSIKQIVKTSLIEEEKETVDDISLQPFAIETYKIKY